VPSKRQQSDAAAPSDALRPVLRRLTALLGANGVETPQTDAELLVSHVLGLTRSELQMMGARRLTESELADLGALADRRARREPLQYVLGEWGFRRLLLTVDRRALIPRPETEVVVERVLALVDGTKEPSVLDVGTGSGAIALAIADEHPGARVTGIDASADALSLARENAERCGLAVQLELRDALDGLPAGPWDVVVSNPPYVPAADRESLAPEVRDWEPADALFANGPDGVTEQVARNARGVLVEGGGLVLEVGDDGAADVASLLDALGYSSVRVTKDLAGRDRVVEGRA
jgi:release factor glutamine methyltransferase